jgi:hypothetical protein
MWNSIFYKCADGAASCRGYSAIVDVGVNVDGNGDVDGDDLP